MFVEKEGFIQKYSQADNYLDIEHTVIVCLPQYINVEFK